MAEKNFIRITHKLYRFLSTIEGDEALIGAETKFSVELKVSKDRLNVTWKGPDVSYNKIENFLDREMKTYEREITNLLNLYSFDHSHFIRVILPRAYCAIAHFHSENVAAASRCEIIVDLTNDELIIFGTEEMVKNSLDSMMSFWHKSFGLLSFKMPNIYPTTEFSNVQRDAIQKRALESVGSINPNSEVLKIIGQENYIVPIEMNHSYCKLFNSINFTCYPSKQYGSIIDVWLNKEHTKRIIRNRQVKESFERAVNCLFVPSRDVVRSRTLFHIVCATDDASKKARDYLSNIVLPIVSSSDEAHAPARCMRCRRKIHKLRNVRPRRQIKKKKFFPS